MRKTFVLAGLMLLVVGFVPLYFAFYYQQRLVKINDLLSEMEGRPALGYPYIVSFSRWMRRTIPLLAAIGIILYIVGGFLLCLPKLSLKT